MSEPVLLSRDSNAAQAAGAKDLDTPTRAAMGGAGAEAGEVPPPSARACVV